LREHGASVTLLLHDGHPTSAHAVHVAAADRPRRLQRLS
jgi:hypothetical protein